MKIFLLSTLLLISFSAFSQSYLILNNGTTLTLDRSGHVYDFYQVHLVDQINHAGGRYFVKDNKLVTVDVSGFLFEKDKKIEGVKARGSNFILLEGNKIITVDSQGFYYEYEHQAISNIINHGGNFFLSKTKNDSINTDLYTVDKKGKLLKVLIEGLSSSEILVFGRMYLQTTSGIIHTVSKYGAVTTYNKLDIGKITKSGGNFFIDSNEKLFTVSDEGVLLTPPLPIGLKVSEVQKAGGNFFIDSSGRLFTVDEAGSLSEQSVLHDLSDLKIIGT
jgi:hypothetical protein